MLLILKAIIIGIVEGITEFLPVSSTGHMIIAGSLIGFDGTVYRKAYTDMFSVVIQLGAILAVVVLYWDKIISTLKNFFPSDRVPVKKCGLKFWINIVIASIPAAVIGIPFNDKIEEKLFYPLPVTIALIVGAIWMIYAENRYRNNSKVISIDDVNAKQAIIIGVFQCLALWPGMSRSASTIIGAWIVGLSTVAAAEFSFFLAIPAMIGASGMSLIKHNVFSTCSSIELIALAAGFIVSFIVALVVIDKFIAFLKKKPMKVFAIYRIVLGIVLIILIYTNIITWH
ncbi:undecaprenyl-diphosphate phosphatase [Clostridium botulinum]|uniref:undecaprenyl-diphosphate phosphatase n=1 Tax=Clostridium botulinum TaxID=1491 RepID=UPI000ECD121E|nr:undecaprenyl-diphosphate phosphatase [Clostridium botulinum]MCC5441044.1 undecaprenyl-diphosphate phosphatase [Clostridium botulinum]MCJ8173700.1 undecaprenyl-diphosphate phosphatase [Clostridium botulinum]NFR59388.1 undecaprenyl-diphosphate phosphatase [Clostridium botulinum]RHW66475.1 undecaprenyl-diphosphate phosphatase [Clostridium botulinum]